MTHVFCMYLFDFPTSSHFKRQLTTSFIYLFRFKTLSIFVNIYCKFYESLVGDWRTTCLTDISLPSRKIVILFRLKGSRMGRSDKVSLWHVSLLVNIRFRFFF